MLLPELLPFICRRDVFIEHAVGDLGGLAVADDQLDEPREVRVRPAAARGAAADR